MRANAEISVASSFAGRLCWSVVLDVQHAVVVPPVGAFGEVIEDMVTGFIADDCSGKSLAECVLTVYNNDVSGICDRAKRFAENFRPIEISYKILAIYNEVTRQKEHQAGV